jgi:general secretion pathway protein J
LRQRGFTLLEIIVVLAVLGFLMVGITQGVRIGVALWHAQARRVEQTAELDAATRVLREILTALPAPPSDSDNNGVNAGTASQFSFIGDMPTGLGTIRRSDMILKLVGQRLVLQWKPHLHETPLGPVPPPAQTELVSGVAGLQLAYWGPPAADRSPTWLSQWDGPAPPPLIRVRLQFAKGDPRHWPDLIVASQL